MTKSPCLPTSMLPIRSADEGQQPVQCQGSDGFFDAKFHVNTRQSNGQRDGTGKTAAGFSLWQVLRHSRHQSFHDRVHKVLSVRKPSEAAG